jgi:hypothetical protein
VKLFADGLQFAALLDLALQEVDPVLELLTFLSLAACDVAYFLLLLTSRIQTVLQLFRFGLTGPELILPVLNVLLADLNIILQFGGSLLILVNFDLIILVLVHGGVEFDLLPLELLDVLILGLDEVVEAVDLLRHECDLVLVVLEVDLDVLVLAEGAV